MQGGKRQQDEEPHPDEELMFGKDALNKEGAFKYVIHCLLPSCHPLAHISYSLSPFILSYLILSYLILSYFFATNSTLSFLCHSFLLLHPHLVDISHLV